MVETLSKRVLLTLTIVSINFVAGVIVDAADTSSLINSTKCRTTGKYGLEKMENRRIQNNYCM